jgi:hypothetical protein
LRARPTSCTVRHRLEQVAEAEARLRHAGAVLKARYSSDGSLLATCSTDGTARVTRLPVSRHKSAGVDLVSHRGVVTSVDLSYNTNLFNAAMDAAPQRPLVLTGSADGTAMLFCPLPWPARS